MGLEIDGVSGIIKNTTSDGDITIKGNDGGSEISALTFDISAAGAATFNNKIVATELDISGDIDVDGTTNLDIVDIDGAVNMATTALVTGVLTTTAATVFNGGFASNAASTITVADNSDTLSLISTDADNNVGPVLRLFRNSASPAYDDVLGNIIFSGQDGAGNETDYLTFQVNASDMDDGAEDGFMRIMMPVASTSTEFIRMNPAGFVFNEGSADLDFRVESNGNTHMLFVDGGADCVNIGGSTDRGGLLNVEGNGGVVIRVADNNDALKLQCTDTDASAGPILSLERSNNSAATDDELGRIVFKAQNNANQAVEYALIRTLIADVTDGSEDGQLFIDLMSGGTSRRTLTMTGTATVFNEDSIDRDFRVESNNNINMFKVDAGDDRTHFGGTSFQGAGLGVHNFHVGTTTDQDGLQLVSNSASYADQILTVRCLRTQSNQFDFINCTGGNGSNDVANDLEFKVKGDGNVSCDESFSGSGADYSEYFEWNDGNSSDVDRVGLSVKLSGNKIVASAGSDDAADIIGVVSGSPVIVGDADGTGTRWTQKYLKDDYGRYLYEEYTVTIWRDEANKTDHSYATDRIPSGITAPDDATVTTTEEDGSTKLLRRKLNPDYNSSLTYVARADRKEWDTVGLVGKLRMKKGQKTGTNWIKLRDISDTVEEWLVR